MYTYKKEEEEVRMIAFSFTMVNYYYCNHYHQPIKQPHSTHVNVW